MAKILISLSILFLTLSAVFGVLNINKARALREAASHGDATAQAEAEQVRLTREKILQQREAALATAAKKQAQAESKLGSAEADLVKFQSEKAALQTQLKGNEAEIAELRKRADGSAPREAGPDDVLPMPGAGDLQTQLEDTRRKLDHAEREKQRLSARIRTTEGHPPADAAPPPGKRAITRHSTPNVRAKVLAVNQAYNFVVLNVGGRQGLEANSEMLVLRGGTLIGKIRVSSVEPATAIGDIITPSLARGVQVQPGDIVIYAGPNS